MTRLMRLFSCLLAVVAYTMVGCQQAHTDVTPQRPAELDHLNMFVGEWEYTMEAHPADSEEVKTRTGVDTYRWACKRRVLVDEWTGMSEGETYEGLMVSTWDPKIKKYRYTSFYGDGGVGCGTFTYDEEAGAWHFKGKSKNPLTGKSGVSEGTLTLPDEKTMTIEGSSWGRWKMKKLVDFKGELRRK